MIDEEHDRLLLERARGGKQPNERWIIALAIAIMLVIGVGTVALFRR